MKTFTNEDLLKYLKEKFAYLKDKKHTKAKEVYNQIINSQKS